MVVSYSDKEIVKFLTQPATIEISREDGSNLEDFSNVLTVKEADITGPIMAVEDEPLMMLRLGPNIIKEYFSNDLDGQHSADEKMVLLDVVEEILVKLDVEDLLRCKTVCKSWYSLISSNLFVKFHLKHLCKTRIRLLLEKDPTRPKLLLACIIVGSSNGLVCVSDDIAQFLVTNPSTREVKKLQSLPYNDRGKSCRGFGYDSSTDDYKVVVGTNEGLHHVRFQVLTLKSNIWKFIGELNYISRARFGSGLLYNEALHWFMADPNNNNKIVILSFDLSHESFKEIPQPDDTKYLCDDFEFHRLGIFEECLCIYRIGFANTTDYLPTWVMKNYNVKQSWELIPYDYEISNYASLTSYKLNFIPYDGWCLRDDKGNISMYQCWDNIGFPIFVKSLVSPYLHGNPKKKNYKRNVQVISSYDVISSSYFFKYTKNKKRKRDPKNNKRNGK
ncbi:F-box protein CPR1-like protein, partial [Tanacetum coccineum]